MLLSTEFSIFNARRTREGYCSQFVCLSVCVFVAEHSTDVKSELSGSTSNISPQIHDLLQQIQTRQCHPLQMGSLHQGTWTEQLHSDCHIIFYNKC